MSCTCPTDVAWSGVPLTKLCNFPILKEPNGKSLSPQRWKPPGESAVPVLPLKAPAPAGWAAPGSPRAAVICSFPRTVFPQAGQDPSSTPAAGVQGPAHGGCRAGAAACPGMGSASGSQEPSGHSGGQLLLPAGPWPEQGGKPEENLCRRAVPGALAMPFLSVLAQHKPLWVHQVSSPRDLVPPPTVGRLQFR